MCRKFSIIDTINIDRIDNEIQCYKIQNRFDPYLFMSEDTANAIQVKLGLDDVMVDGVSLSDIRKERKDGTYATYTGSKVFINNDLKFGIVEIR